jgi:PAS domain S-box-containing protein
LRSDKSGPRRGTLIFARFLDQPQIDHISKLSALKLRLVSPSAVPQGQTYVQSSIGPMLIVAPDDGNIVGYLPLTDLAGDQALTLEVTRARQLHRQAHVSAAYFTKWLLGIIGLSAVLLLLGLESLVLRRLSRASDALDEVAKSGDVTARLPEAGNDELGRLINGMNGALAAIERNVLDQRAAAREMTRLNQLVVSFMTYSPMALFVKEFPGGRYITWNPAAEQIYGVSADQVLGKDASAVLDPEHAERMTELEQQALESGTPFSASDEIVTPEGEKRLLHVRKVPIPGASDDQAYLVGIAEDVTEFRQQQAQLQKTLQELARSNTELEQFAYVASHDLQEPLRMVASYVQLLSRRYRGQLDADADDFIDFAVDGATRMQGLINDLLAYSRVGTRGKEFAPLSLEKALDTALQNLRVAVGESKAEITHDPLPEVIGDEGQLGQVLQNLVANALKFRREEAPQIHLSARHDGKQWTIGVQDNGIGIESQYLNRIFIIFQRLYTREEYAGTGIGLAICKRIVERHGGRIWVESTPGTGSTFYFTIPDDPEES